MQRKRKRVHRRIVCRVKVDVGLGLFGQHVRSICNLSSEDRIDFWVTPEWGSQFGNRHGHIVLILPNVPTVGFAEDALVDDVDGQFDGVPDLSEHKVSAVVTYYKKKTCARKQPREATDTHK